MALPRTKSRPAPAAPAAARPPCEERFARAVGLLQVPEDGPEVLDLAGPVLGLARLAHAGGSLIGRGMIHASYTTIPRNTSFMIPKFAAMTW